MLEKSQEFWVTSAECLTNGGRQRGLDCGLGYCCICGIWLLFRVEGGLHFLYFWILDPGI